MAKFLVQSGEPLVGDVYISGAKNAILPLMTAGRQIGRASCRERV